MYSYTNVFCRLVLQHDSKVAFCKNNHSIFLDFFSRYILDNHPELFEKNLIEMVPKIKRYMPRVKVTAKNACPELLMNYIQSSNVVQSVETYKLLEEKGDADMVDTSLKQRLLELVLI